MCWIHQNSSAKRPISPFLAAGLFLTNGKVARTHHLVAIRVVCCSATTGRSAIFCCPRTDWSLVAAGTNSTGKIQQIKSLKKYKFVYIYVVSDMFHVLKSRFLVRDENGEIGRRQTRENTTHPANHHHHLMTITLINYSRPWMYDYCLFWCWFCPFSTHSGDSRTEWVQSTSGLNGFFLLYCSRKSLQP